MYIRRIVRMVAYSFINFSNDELLQLFPEQSLEKKEIKRMVINLETQETNCKTYNVVPKTIKGTMDILSQPRLRHPSVRDFLLLHGDRAKCSVP